MTDIASVLDFLCYIINCKLHKAVMGHIAYPPKKTPFPSHKLASVLA